MAALLKGVGDAVLDIVGKRRTQMTFVVALSSFIAVIGIVMLLLWGIERIETRLRRVAPALFSS
jgi:uncharacterized membrane-anchored protein